MSGFLSKVGTMAYGLVQVLNSFNSNLNVGFCFMYFSDLNLAVHLQIPATILGVFLFDKIGRRPVLLVRNRKRNGF